MGDGAKDDPKGAAATSKEVDDHGTGYLYWMMVQNRRVVD